jgi:hypothetical protein
MKKRSERSTRVRDRTLKKIDRSIDDLSERLNQLYDRSLKLAVKTRKSFRPESNNEADRYDALRRGIEAGRAATADIDAEIARLERQRDDLYDRRAELDGRSVAPVSLKEAKRLHITHRLDEIRNQWLQHLERWDRGPDTPLDPALQPILKRFKLEVASLTRELDQLDAHVATVRKPIKQSRPGKKRRA